MNREPVALQRWILRWLTGYSYGKKCAHTHRLQMALHKCLRQLYVTEWQAEIPCHILYTHRQTHKHTDAGTPIQLASEILDSHTDRHTQAQTRTHAKWTIVSNCAIRNALLCGIMWLCDCVNLHVCVLLCECVWCVCVLCVCLSLLCCCARATNGANENPTRCSWLCVFQVKGKLLKIAKLTPSPLSLSSSSLFSSPLFLSLSLIVLRLAAAVLGVRAEVTPSCSWPLLRVLYKMKFNVAYIRCLIWLYFATRRNARGVY